LTRHRSVRRVTTTALLLVAGVAACTRAAPGGAIAPMSGKRVESDRGMVAASHPDAAAAGAAILAQGGNAIDAFAATAFALSVTDVSQTGLGGGGALTYYNARSRTVEHLSRFIRARVRTNAGGVPIPRGSVARGARPRRRGWWPAFSRRTRSGASSHGRK
jgi:hypothetical protein